MSVNCIKCGLKPRTGPDLKCDNCREKVSPAIRDAIIDERFGNWRGRLQQEHATPIVCCAVGHDHNMGRFVICIPEGITLSVAQLYLAAALAKVNEAIARGES